MEGDSQEGSYYIAQARKSGGINQGHGCTNWSLTLQNLLWSPCSKNQKSC